MTRFRASEARVNPVVCVRGQTQRTGGTYRDSQAFPRTSRCRQSVHRPLRYRRTSARRTGDAPAASGAAATRLARSEGSQYALAWLSARATGKDASAIAVAASHRSWIRMENPVLFSVRDGTRNQHGISALRCACRGCFPIAQTWQSDHLSVRIFGRGVACLISREPPSNDHRCSVPVSHTCQPVCDVSNAQLLPS